MIKPKVLIGPSPGVDITCFLHKVEFKPDQDTNDNDTFCGTYRSYGPVRWTITLSLFQSFGAGNAWDILAGLQMQTVHLEVTPSEALPVGTVDNPTVAAEVTVPPMPFLTSDVGEASDMDLDLDVQGGLTYTPEPTGLGTGGAASAPASSSAAA
jgi:hypothetical protein